jgi:exopolyphosphatase/guanosine-5'-triphosphate,3'-diphosphate pyrophosphatase
VGTSGTLLNLTAMAAALKGRKAPAKLHNRPLRHADLTRLREIVLESDADERARIPGLDRRRVDLIPAGVVLVDVLLCGFDVPELRACEWALREGILLDFIARHREEVEAAEKIPDVRRRSVVHLAERLRSEPDHGRHVANLSLQLFDATRGLHGLERTDRELLEFAALLHDVGLYISHSKHHRHSQYLITHGELRGFTPEEIQIIAAVARFHKGAPPKASHEDLSELPPEGRHLVIQLASILRIADSLDRSHHGIVRALRVARRNGRMEVRLDTGGRDAALELWGADRKSDLFERRFGTELDFRVFGRR